MSERKRKTTSLQVVLGAETGAWADLLAKKEDGTLIDARDAESIVLATVENGMTSGLPALVLRIDLPDGRTVVAATSVANLLAAAAIVSARHKAEIEARGGS